MKKQPAKTPAASQNHRLFEGVCVVFALLIAGVTVAQLFYLDEMMGHQRLTLFAAKAVVLCMIVCAVFSLPYILKLKTHKMIGAVSFGCALAMPAFWLAFSVITIGAGDIGLFGKVFAADWVSFDVTAVVVAAMAFVVKYRGGVSAINGKKS